MLIESCNKHNDAVVAYTGRKCPLCEAESQIEAQEEKYLKLEDQYEKLEDAHAPD